jgi:hypothetical protein
MALLALFVVGPVSALPVHAAKGDKEAEKVSKVIATINGEDLTKSDYDEAIKGNRRFFDLTREPVRRRLDGRPWTEYVFAEELVKVRAFAQSRAAELPAMRERVSSAAERIAAGEDFAAVAGELSQDPVSAVDGGSLGEAKEFFDLVHPFNRVAFSLKEGEVSEPVLTIFGYHIIKVEKIYPAMEGRQRRVDVRHILIKFQGNPRNDAEQTLAQAKVEILVKTPYCKALPSYCEAVK